ncbi:MAG: hypothetical protein ABEK02_06895 [Haloquadratum sp.]
MSNVLPTVAAAFVILLYGIALFALANGHYATAGVTFLSASLVIYLRETRLVETAD